MNLAKKIVSVAAGVALVAGIGAVAATPATAKTKYSGTTVISFKKELAPIVAAIVAESPAKIAGTRLSFPVSNVKGNAVEHRGGIAIGPTKAINPIILIGEKNTASITLEVVGLARAEIFTIKNFKMRKQTKKQQVWQGFLHVTTNPAIVEALNASAGAAVFTPDMGLGQIRTTINIKK
jgi:hypothetical protein